MEESSRFRIYCKSWTAPKNGNPHAQNEDASRVVLQVEEHSPVRLLFALADGTTEAVYSSAWARFLVEHADWEWPTMNPGDFRQMLQSLRQEFVPFAENEQPPWYVRNKFLTQGSQATFLVVRVSDNAKGSMDVSAASIGDGCVFHFRPSGLCSAFPIAESQGFGSNPSLLTTRPHHEVDLEYWHSEALPGDLLLLATDAVAHWIISALEADLGDALLGSLQALLETETLQQAIQESGESENDNREPQLDAEDQPADWWRFMHAWWKKFRTVDGQGPAPDFPHSLRVDPESFDAFVEKWRQSDSIPRMRNDDSSLVLISLLPHDHDESTAGLAADVRDQVACMRAAKVLAKPVYESDCIAIEPLSVGTGS